MAGVARRADGTRRCGPDRPAESAGSAPARRPARARPGAPSGRLCRRGPVSTPAPLPSASIARAWLGGAVLAGFAFVVALQAGASDAGALDLLQRVWRDGDATATAILFHVRVPRALGAFVCGACLSLAGVLLQAATRNPVADPYLVGTSAGATLAAVLAMPLAGAVAAAVGVGVELVTPVVQPLAAFGGALFAVTLAFGLARAGGPKVRAERVLLAGLVITAFAGAATSFALYQLSDARLRAATWWLMGGVSATSAWAAVPGGVLVVAALGWSLASAARLNALGLGAEAAQGLGLDETRIGRHAMVWSSALAAAAVSLAGIIGFVGLLVPHGLRALVGRDHRALVPGAVLAGGAFLCVADMLARVVVAPAELPLGILTALAGCPVLLALFGRERTQRPSRAKQHPTADAVLRAEAGPESPVAGATSLVAGEPPVGACVASAAAAVVGCRDAAVHYPGRPDPALRHASLDLHAGTLTLIVGPNGGGKTSLLRLLGGLVPPASGTVYDGGHPRERAPARAGAAIALLPQDPTAEPGLVVSDLVLLGRAARPGASRRLRLWGEPDATERAAAQAALATVDLAGSAASQVDELSGGQRQRAFVAMVLAQEPAVLLLDEPTANLDARQARNLIGGLADTARQRGTAVAIAIHDLAVSLPCADVVVVVCDGRIVAAGPPDAPTVRSALRGWMGVGPAGDGLPGDGQPNPT
ncbi:MAG: ATP-binding cassette domain-containing protein [Myxococcales bacterium]|nr:ATP-binding cassette domain-containing protein [Myxococcales bacterium]